MTAWIIIPVKRLAEAKSSFSKVLRLENRKKLVLAMLTDMLNTARESPSISEVAVVSNDSDVLDFAAKRGAVGMVEKDLGLNGALKLAIGRVESLGADLALVLPGDLPLLKPSDVENIIAMATAERDVVIAPSKANGTNALLLKPPSIMGLKFGGESFPLHLAEAMRAGVKPRIYRSETVAFDVDEPEDLPKVEALGLGTKTREFLLAQTKSMPYLKRK